MALSKSIRLVNGHFDGETERPVGPPQQCLHKRLPHGDWVDSATGATVTHDVYRLTAGETATIYSCTQHAIEKAVWLKLQAIKSSR